MTYEWEPAFRARLDERSPDECWIWLGGHDGGGYGWFSHGNAIRGRAHQFAYLLAHGQPAEPGMTIDHLCRNRGCANPRHLEVVTRGENVRRGFIGRPRKTHCLRGHEYALVGQTGRRVCRRCKTDRELAKYHATKTLKGLSRQFCHRGHALTPENRYEANGRPQGCVTCRRARSLAYWYRHRSGTIRNA